MTRKLIAFSGAAGAGKSEASNQAVASGYHRAKFANAIKEMLRTFLRYRGADETTIERMLEGDLKGTSSEYFGGRTPRHAMQTLGTEWGRKLIHPDLWVVTEIDASSSFDHVVFDDCRFPNEVAAIKVAGGQVIEIERPDLPSRMDHASENQKLDVDAIVSNDGTLDDLRTKIDKLL